MRSDLLPLPTASKPRIILHRAATPDQAAANAVARALGCRVIERHWPAWSQSDTLTTLVRWTLIVEERREYLGRPLRREPAAARSDWADCERQLGVPLAHLILNARLHGLPMPAAIATADVPTAPPAAPPG
ncbi:MAG: hypothetical protein O9319_00215 [Gemmatimonas sp.]|uniref:hypothetical protein n=1 Tax=Gemmatimonas sp. TaxID=1962908 RepID=UPI0022C1225E|nr:hypothetical protein [Gemmatimonas sp.]MCZ8012980.1 hypothetical protein [Gemmatimonas sp.]MCZ8265253.1 hypothetical protein [Gemmatimonas sp.]